jgi:2-polyprenyl-6-methoxyphenol hydroxylase-like FAD-dependent oxidoreductase
MAKTPQDLQIAILGAGMGGLTTAVALAQRGFKNIHVYENATNLGFVGAGIQLAPNMARVLDSLGVWKGIEAEAVIPIGILKCTPIEIGRETSGSRNTLWELLQDVHIA